MYKKLDFDNLLEIDEDSQFSLKNPELKVYYTRNKPHDNDLIMEIEQDTNKKFDE